MELERFWKNFEYVAIFMCFSKKPVHIEPVVSDQGRLSYGH